MLSSSASPCTTSSAPRAGPCAKRGRADAEASGTADAGLAQQLMFTPCGGHPVIPAPSPGWTSTSAHNQPKETRCPSASTSPPSPPSLFLPPEVHHYANVMAQQHQEERRYPQEDQGRACALARDQERGGSDGRPQWVASGSGGVELRAARRFGDQRQAGGQRRGLGQGRSGQPHGCRSRPQLGGSSEVAPNSVGSGDIGSSAINGSELAGDSVQGDEVQNGSLDAVDVGLYSGTSAENFSSIAAGTCDTVGLDPSTSTDSIAGKAALVTPRSGFSGSVSFHAEVETSTPRAEGVQPHRWRHRPRRRRRHELQLHRVRLSSRTSSARGSAVTGAPPTAGRRSF